MKNLVCSLFAIMLLSACASIDGSSSQHVALSTFYHGEQIDGVDCKLTNNKGSWTIVSQGSAHIRKSRGDLTVICTKDNMPTGKAIVASGMPDGTWIDFAAGGFIGTAIDSANEAIFSYPNYIVIEMGRNLSLNPSGKTVP